MPMTAGQIKTLVAAEVQRAIDARGQVANENREPEVMSADDVAVFLGVDRKTVYDYANRGVIPHQRLGKRLLFSRSALVAWLAGHAGSRRIGKE